MKLRASFGGQFLMSLLGEAPGRETNELARTCVDELNSAAPWAMDILVSRRPRTVDNEFALAHYKSFIARFPNMTDWFVSYFSANPTPNAEIVFADGLENSSQRIAEAAAIAILRQNIEERLPELARRILARRRDDPLFKIGLATADPVKSPQDKVARQAEVARILQTVSGTDAHSAQVYARAYPILADAYSASDSPLSPEANACLESLRKCVAAYQDSRRQNPPQ
ncbi:MAG: hypothetical protein HZB26_00920 [Candidatus Hydrogenedentes bacterium]|nr:hypothetical protein [Candidatus Hydrogenedentota bacterium]